MTKRDAPERTLTGEQVERRRRIGFWMYGLIFTVLGIAIGFIAGFFEGRAAISNPVFALFFVAVALLVYTYLSVRFFRSVDELELADNLWGALFAVYFLIAFQPAWYFLHEVGLVPPVDPWVTYFSVSFAFLAAYLGRKIVNR